jgi:hypothetical protein
MDQMQKPNDPSNQWDGNDFAPNDPIHVAGDWGFTPHFGPVDDPTWVKYPSRPPDPKVNGGDTPTPNPVVDLFKGRFDGSSPPPTAPMPGKITVKGEAAPANDGQDWMLQKQKEEHGFGQPPWLR